MADMGAITVTFDRNRHLLKVGANAIRQSLNADAIPVFQRYRPFDGVLKLANISRPIVDFHTAHGFRVHTIHLFAHGFREASEKFTYQEWDIVTAFTQWRKMNGDDTQA